ncbi:MAG: EAL domain-containing protein [Ruminiclostridium sp.]|nr:EAL domain-containing protein [Ruminiclostridium sp.]
MGKRMTELELLNGFDEAIENDHIFVCYQPKMNHATGRMIGAEALMRWNNPEYGMQYPSDFIPVLEQNDLIYKADLYVFERVCMFQREMLDKDLTSVPISFNMSRHDIIHSDYIDELERIRTKYNVPVKLLHAEITESSALGGMELITETLNRLHALGYFVEMDDFGSGYSSLNVLKDLNVDMIKLDMRFLSGNVGGRGGTIISSIVQMSKWLNTPVVAEGVETVAQADYMRSIGCIYIQGYVYSKPVTEGEFEKMLTEISSESGLKSMQLISTMDAERFWDPNSLETLIFNNYVGGAALFRYHDGKCDILRINQKYMKEIGMNMSEKEILCSDPMDGFDDENRKIFEDTLKLAAETGEEQSCETWRNVCSKICGSYRICVRSDIRMIGKADDQYIFYAMVRNITAEKRRFAEISDSERKFRMASEQINVYAWEYIFSTKEMHPCYRCMRDLGLPLVVENYPDPVFANGLFPQDYKEMYYDMLHRLEQGEEQLDAIIPLTVGRVPFHIRYTTEFDENGKPLKAYGSAALVQKDND